jgi:RHS repeat-associated protein
LSRFSVNGSGGVTGLQNNGERWYDAGTGGWLSQDPSGFGGGDANLYRYCGNGPTNAEDPSGLCAYGYVDITEVETSEDTIMPLGSGSADTLGGHQDSGRISPCVFTFPTPIPGLPAFEYRVIRRTYWILYGNGVLSEWDVQEIILSRKPGEPWPPEPPLLPPPPGVSQWQVF